MLWSLTPHSKRQSRRSRNVSLPASRRVCFDPGADHLDGRLAQSATGAYAVRAWTPASDIPHSAEKCRIQGDQGTEVRVLRAQHAGAKNEASLLELSGLGRA